MEGVGANVSSEAEGLESKGGSGLKTFDAFGRAQVELAKPGELVEHPSSLRSVPYIPPIHSQIVGSPAARHYHILDPPPAFLPAVRGDLQFLHLGARLESLLKYSPRCPYIRVLFCIKTDTASDLGELRDRDESVEKLARASGQRVGEVAK